jgi:membrane protein
MFRNALTLVKRTITEWKEDKADRLAAALAYYAAFSLAPILVIAISVASIFYERSQVQGLVVEQIQALAGSEGGELILTMLEASSNLGSNVIATVMGVVLLIFGATGFFGQLQDAMNVMWEVKPKEGRGIMGLIKDRFFSFTMVLGVALLLLISLVVSAALGAVQTWSVGLFPGFEAIVQILNLVISFGVITLLYALLFKYVPDAEIRWRDVWLGAAVTALLFTIGKFLIGLYLGSGGVSESFGPAGALVVLLLWVYYSAQISFFGAEFTQVYANLYGSRVEPAEHAERVGEQERIEQGMKRETGPQEGQPSPAAPGFAYSQPQRTLAAKANEPRDILGEEPKPILVFSSVVSVLVGVVGGLLIGMSGRSKNEPGQDQPEGE